jgi:two-component system, cell cycle sensor histidine kinase and response regulator CckA
MAIPNSYDILQAVIEATPDAIFVKDLDGRYVLVNEAFARFIGKSLADIVGKNDFELYPEEDARNFVEADKHVLATGMAQQFEGVATGEAGPQTYLVTKGVYQDKDGRFLGVYGISHDISELKHAHETLEQTREALFRSQKMEAVGQLTGGIAHDFNNILAIILGNIELLQAYLPQDPYTSEIVDAIVRATLHGKDLTGHLLAFSRRRLLNPQAVDVNALVAGVVRLLSRTLGATIQVTTTASHEAGTAFADPAALEAAVLNVALNARDAMPEGGALTIRMSTASVTRRPKNEDDPTPGHYALIEIEDTGCGMPPDVVARVFEPFFTTKSSGRGTGLGLSMVYGFAKQSGGTVMIVSEVGRGTTVKMYLPLAGSEPAPDIAPADPVDVPAVSRTILVVEDEADVRHTVRRQLESLGHRVLVAEAATEALLLLQGPGAPELLLTDVVLPTGINGIDLAEAALAARAGLRVIFMSGYTAVPEAQQRIRDTGAPLLSKPFTTPQLERAVKAAFAATSR